LVRSGQSMTIIWITGKAQIPAAAGPAAPLCDFEKPRWQAAGENDVAVFHWVEADSVRAVAPPRRSS